MNAGMDLSAVLKKNADLQKRIQNLEHLSSVGEMATHLLHDMRQPLNIVHAGVDSLATLDLSSDEREEIAAIVQQELQRFGSMVQDIMELARGRISTRFSVLHSEGLFGKLKTMLERQMKNSPVNYRALFDGREAAVRIDERKILRAAGNLINNASEALANSSILRPEIYLRVDSSPEWLNIHVSDNGPGIPESIRHKIFEPFVTAGKEKGVGIGLCIVRKIVDEHDGTLWFTTGPGSGTTFTLRLPNRAGGQATALQSERLAEVQN